MPCDWKNEYDQRQYRLMAEQLGAFDERHLPLSDLVANLRGLAAALESPNAEWKDEFLSEWGALETVYALTLDYKEQGLVSNIEAMLNSPSYLPIINTAIHRMQQLVLDRLQEK